MDRVQRREMLIKYFNDSELRTLCFELNVEYEDLGGASRSGKALELVTYCERHGLTPRLEEAILARAAQAQAAASAPSQRPPTAATTFNMQGQTVSQQVIVQGNYYDRSGRTSGSGLSAGQAAPVSESKTFADLEIRIRKREEAGYPVEMRLNNGQVFETGFVAADVAQWSSGGDLAADGRRLYTKLLADSMLRANWAEARGQSRRRRLRWWIDDTATELHAVPWELMQDGLVMLAADADTPFSRFLPVNLPWSGPVEERPIRVLVGISNPHDLENFNLPPVDVALERATLQAAFDTVGSSQLQAEFLDSPVTLERLEKRLRDGQHHVLHFLGHGRYDDKRRQAMLYLQDAHGNARPARDVELAGMLARQGAQPQLVFLAACQSATRSTADAFVGLGPTLVTIGAPAVVAMQESVSVVSARTFSAAFYERLLKHGLVDLAANEARGTLLTAGRPDAAVPVLFMRLRDGRLWSGE